MDQVGALDAAETTDRRANPNPATRAATAQGLPERGLLALLASAGAQRCLVYRVDGEGEHTCVVRYGNATPTSISDDAKRRTSAGEAVFLNGLRTGDCVLLLPLRVHGAVRGKIALYWDRPTDLAPDQLQHVQTLADLLALALVDTLRGDAPQSERHRPREVEMLRHTQVALVLVDAASRRVLRLNDAAQRAPFDRLGLLTGAPLELGLGGLPSAALFDRAARGEEVRCSGAWREDGRAHAFDFTLTPVRDGGDTAPRVLLGIVDVGSHAAERRRLQEVLDGLPQAVIAMAPAGSVTFANRAMVNLSLSMPLDRLPLPKLLAGEPIAGVELLLRRPDGSEAVLLANGAPLRDSHGGPRGAVVTLADVTALRHEHRLKDEFLSITSHELRTPLSTAKACVALAEQTLAAPAAPAQDAIKQLRAIDGQLDRISRMVDDLLDVSRIDHGELSVHPTPHAVDDVIGRAVRSLGHLAAPRPVRFHASGQSDRLQALLDEERIEQVLANLLTNAAKHSAPGSAIDVEVALGERLNARRCAVVTVRDSGVGIPPDVVARIFERYFTLEQAHGLGRPRRRGVGLGLYISDQIVRKHGGAMWADSEPGKGTAVSFALPLSGEDDL
jgi:signal transduction histidine kinase